jgi:hypothetical protein
MHPRTCAARRRQAQQHPAQHGAPSACTVSRRAQVLFYVRLCGDILGRVAPRRLQVQSKRWLLLLSLAKTALMLPLLANMFYPEAWLGDAGAVLLVAAFWVLSGYLNTGAYLVGPTLVAPSQAGRAGGLMACAFQTSCFLGLMLAYALQAWLQPQ